MGPCPHYDCTNRNSFGYCNSTACINPNYNFRSLTTMQTVEVVRCKDCKWRGELGRCRNMDSYYMWYSRPNDDDFCSLGERKDDDKH